MVGKLLSFHAAHSIAVLSYDKVTNRGLQAGTESLSNIAQTPIQQILPQTPQPPQHSYPNPPSIPNPSPTQHLRENNNPSNAPASEPPLPNPSITLTTADLSAYLSNPASERSALIESWVCQQLDSDAFLALCQDVEGVWKRVVFGM